MVEHLAWRTGKNMDLLRLLALDNGRPVRAESLVETLWPDSRPDRGRHSLRTAATQLRHALGGPHVERRPHGLVLLSAWVDVEAFESHAVRAQEAAASGRDAEVLLAAHAADELYAGDLRASDDAGTWVISRRAYLETVHQELCTTAAQAALRLGLPHEALSLALRAAALDPASEAAHRALIEAYADLGEVAHALLVFERLRTRLAEELGADPSPQTRSLHLRVLRSQT
jgi:DNA-binding SARP family transcriptional activator